MIKAMTPKATSVPQYATSAEKVLTKPSITSLLTTVSVIMVASVVTSTIGMVIITAIAEMSRQVNTASIDTLFDLIATIFFTMLLTIAAGADAVQLGLMAGVYAGVTLSIFFLVYSWLSVRKGLQIDPTWRRGQ